MRLKLSKFIFWSLLFSVILRLGLSNWLLNVYYPYSIEGGAWYQKIHPATFFAIFIFIIVAHMRGPFRYLKEQYRSDFSVFQFFMILLLVAIISIMRFGSGGTAYLVDTFIIGIVYVMLATHISPIQKDGITKIIIIIVCANSVIALSEVGFGYHLIEQAARFSFFRASALFGHPLTNGLITTFVGMSVLKMPWKWYLKSALLMLLILSLLAFGARGALTVLLIGIISFFAIGPFRSKFTVRAKMGLIPIAYIASFLVLVIISFLVFQTDLGANIAARLTYDASIEERFDSIAILNYFTFEEILWGIEQHTLLYLVERNQNVNIIENFWIILLLRLGLPLFIVFLISFMYFTFCQLKKGDWKDGLIMFTFLLTASTNNSLSSKNAAFPVFILLLVCLRKIRMTNGVCPITIK